MPTHNKGGVLDVSLGSHQRVQARLAPELPATSDRETVVIGIAGNRRRGGTKSLSLSPDMLNSTPLYRTRLGQCGSAGVRDGNLHR